MSLGQLINKLLAPLGLIVMRKDTFSKISSTSQLIHSVDVENKIKSDTLLKYQIYSKWSLFDLLSKKEKALPLISCPLCNTEHVPTSLQVYNSYCAFGGGELKRYQCSSCDLIFGPFKMLSLSKEELTQEYEWHYSVFSEGDTTEHEIRAFKSLNPIKEGIYLNYGSGAWSKAIKILRDEGWNVYGYEPHSNVASGLVFIIGSKMKLQECQFDGIFSNNVLEHLRHPTDELMFMKSLLKENGRMSHATPCFEYLYDYTRFHLFFFVGKSKELLAKKAGLQVKKFVNDGEYKNIILE